MRRTIFLLSVAFVAFLFSACDYEPVISKIDISMVRVAPIEGDTFYIGQYEVTQKEWRAIMGTNPSNNHSGDSYPVENVTYSEVQEFISKLNERTGLQYRLPTVDEWEIAAYAANREFYTYPGCNTDSELKDFAWIINNSKDVHKMPQTHSVGLKKSNGLKIYDMAGNVSEMTSDMNYLGDKIYTKGGTCYSSAASCKISATDSILTSVRGIRCGFRLARNYK